MKTIKWTPADSRDMAANLRAARTAQSPAEYATAVQHEEAKSTDTAAGVALAIIGGIVTAAMLVHWWSS